MKYKVGDRVKIQSLERYNKYKNRYGDINYGCETEILFTSEMSSFCGQVVTITRVRYIGCVRFYHLAEDKGDHLWVDGMFEGLVEELLDNDMKEHQKICDEVLTIQGIEPIEAEMEQIIHCPEGYIFKDENGNVINATKIVLEKKKKEYPKSYEECCQVLEIEGNSLLINTKHITDYERDLGNLMGQLHRLIICRDAYWKIVGEKMGLGKPWEPDYDSGVNKYGIICMNGVVQKSSPTTNWERHLNKVLDFPTEEMRGAFYENFKEEIEICKELL